MGVGILITAVFTLLTPVAARLGGAEWLIAVRILEGLGEVSVCSYFLKCILWCVCVKYSTFLVLRFALL